MRGKGEGRRGKKRGGRERKDECALLLAKHALFLSLDEAPLPSHLASGHAPPPARAALTID